MCYACMCGVDILPRANTLGSRPPKPLPLFHLPPHPPFSSRRIWATRTVLSHCQFNTTSFFYPRYLPLSGLERDGNSASTRYFTPVRKRRPHSSSLCSIAGYHGLTRRERRCFPPCGGDNTIRLLSGSENLTRTGTNPRHLIGSR
jgi:hypothetical protein